VAEDLENLPASRLAAADRLLDPVAGPAGVHWRQRCHRPRPAIIATTVAPAPAEAIRSLPAAGLRSWPPGAPVGN
jgi:hypothetical protein